MTATQRPIAHDYNGAVAWLRERRRLDTIVTDKKTAARIAVLARDVSDQFTLPAHQTLRCFADMAMSGERETWSDRMDMFATAMKVDRTVLARCLEKARITQTIDSHHTYPKEK